LKKIFTHHVGVIPVSWACEGAHVVLFLAEVVENVPQTSIRVLNIVKVAPQVAMLGKDGVIGLKIQSKNYLYVFHGFLYFFTSIPCSVWYAGQLQE